MNCGNLIDLNDSLSNSFDHCMYLSTTEAYMMFSKSSFYFANSFGLFNKSILFSGGDVLMKIVFLELLRKGNESAI